jgi:hypothetical protein
METTPLSIKGTKEDKFSGSHTLNYLVEARSTDSDFDPMSVTEAHVYLQAGTWPNGKLPIVNRSIYKFGSFYLPFFVCRNKSLKRNPKRRSQFDVSCAFEFSGEGGEGSEPQEEDVPLTSIAPRVETTIEETTIALYRDFTPSADGGPKAIITPNRNFFAEPTLCRVPVLTLRITQYEESITYEQMLDRSLKCNETTYREQERYKWISEIVTATEAEVSLPSGTNVAAQVVYTLKLSPFPWGWRDSKILIDSHYRPTPGAPPVPFIDRQVRAKMLGFINADGTAKADTVTFPDYIDFETQRTIDFGFLTV